MDDCVCQLDAKRAEEAPRVFTAIHAHYIVKGKDLTEKMWPELFSYQLKNIVQSC
ncbi:OsmC-like protein [Paraglaciecola psychrophila 170]|uniref:OsmC-like protein n=1 Tax=Paraglaciecola psychrophila 170 TaxID=1129794 RepID=K7A301_9ALTE|nr:OsmC-like protein [Paraglaciecola psychrophila 170]GAC36757.1 hypothetical protein GPSY_1119 [Paraglaciecola psychrophila 170]